MKPNLLMAVMAVWTAKTLLAQHEDFPARVESEGRVVEWVSGSEATIENRDSLVLQAMGYLPRGSSELPIEVQINEPVQIDGQTIVSGRYLFSGLAGTGCDFRMVFAGDTMIAVDRPIITEADIFVAPPPVRVSTDAAREIAVRHSNELYPGVECAVAVSEISFSRESGRVAYHVALSREHSGADLQAIPEPPLGETTYFEVDATTGGIFDLGRFSLNATLSGVCRGESLALAGASVRHSQGPHNLREFRGVRGVPLLLRHPELAAPVVSTTRSDGSFELEVPEQGDWTIVSDFTNSDFTLEFTPNAHPVETLLTGQGGQVIDVTFLHDPNDPAIRESMAGTLFAWELLNTLRQWGEEVRLRNNIVWLSIGAPKRGIAGNRSIRVVRAESRPDRLPFGGLYFDCTGTPTIGLSEANDLYHCFANAGVIAHEWGHSLLLSFTGQNTCGPPPHGHDLIIHEVIADVMAWLYQEEVDLSGEPQGVVGLGQKRGFEDVEFTRNIRLGHTCDRNLDADRPCTPRGGLGLFPVIGEVHVASLPISGFFYDLGLLLKERYGDLAGHQRITDLVVRFLAYHSGGIVGRFGYQQIAILLLLNDHEHFGGDQIPFNYGPDWDLIRQAALGRNLWLIPFERGDSDGSGDRTISDAVLLLNYLFLGSGEPSCHDAADADDSGELTLTDAVRLLQFLFLGGEALPLPHLCRDADPTRRLDPTPLDQLTCRMAGSHCSS